MSHHEHKSIIVSCMYYFEVIDEAHRIACELFSAEAVSPLERENEISTSSFMVRPYICDTGPSISREDEKRARFIAILTSLKREQQQLEWVAVNFGDEDARPASIVDDSSGRLR